MKKSKKKGLTSGSDFAIILNCIIIANYALFTLVCKTLY